MSLLPVRGDFNYPIVYLKQAGLGAPQVGLPAQITCYVECTPLVGGSYKKVINTPDIVPSVATTISDTYYAPDPNNPSNVLNMVARFQSGYNVMIRDDTTAAGTINTSKDTNYIIFNTTNGAGKISANKLLIETYTT